MDKEIKKYNQLLRYYEQNYEQPIEISSYENSDWHYIGRDNESRCCRFCGKKFPEVTFYKKAHAIPEFTGNHSIVSYEECDSCNKYFAETYEDNFGKYSLPLNAATQVQGKNRGAGKGRIPTYKSKDQKTKIQTTNNIIDISGSQNHGTLCVDRINNIIKVTAETQPYIARSAYKCLVKMALSLIDKSLLPLFKETIKWILNPNLEESLMNDNHYSVIRSFISGPKFYKGNFNILLKKRLGTTVPFLFYITGFGNVSYQILVPCPQMDTHTTKDDLNINVFPMMFWLHPDPINYISKYGIIQCQRENWSCTNKSTHCEYITYNATPQDESM